MLNQNHYHYVIISSLLILIIAACGSRPTDGNGDTGQADSGSSRGSNVQAMPTANFSSVAEQSGITTTTEIAAPAVEEEDSAAALALGERVYGNKCAECHGASGEGITDKGSAVAGTQLTFDDFEDLLRTGGDIGPDHLFGTLAVSENGLAGLHAYLAAQ